MEGLVDAARILSDKRFTLNVYSSGVGGGPYFSFPHTQEDIQTRLMQLAEVYTPLGISGRS